MPDLENKNRVPVKFVFQIMNSFLVPMCHMHYLEHTSTKIAVKISCLSEIEISLCVLCFILHPFVCGTVNIYRHWASCNGIDLVISFVYSATLNTVHHVYNTVQPMVQFWIRKQWVTRKEDGQMESSKLEKINKISKIFQDRSISKTAR